MKKLIFFVFMILATLAMVLCACVIFDRVDPLASAEEVTLPANGIVGENLVLNSDFTHGTTGFQFTYGMTGYVDSNSSLVVSGSATNQRFIFDLTSYIEVGSTYTLSFYVLPNSTLFAYIWSSSLSSIIASKNITSSSSYKLISITFTVPTGGERCSWRFNGSATFSAVFQWFKLELGSTFTGYVPNYAELVINERDRIYDANDGWTNSYYYRDYTADNYSSEILTSSGEVEFQVGVGTTLTSFSSPTTFSLNLGSRTLYESNFSGTIAISYSIVSGSDVYFRFTYDYYERQVGGTSIFSRAFSLPLDDSGLLIKSFDDMRTVPYNLSIAFLGTGSIVLKAVKFEFGDVFTHFSTGGSDDVSSYQNGYNTGVSVGYKDGFLDGSNDGYGDGFALGLQQGDSQGYTRGFQSALEQYEHGNWFDMLSALINVPVQFIWSLISFDILGFNMANVFRAVVLLSLFFYIVRKLI